MCGCVNRRRWCLPLCEEGRWERGECGGVWVRRCMRVFGVQVERGAAGRVLAAHVNVAHSLPLGVTSNVSGLRVMGVTSNGDGGDYE